MTEAEKLRALAERRMEKADRVLRASRTLLEESFFEDAVNRGYYAMFHAASALLLVRGHSTSKHRGVLSLLDLHFVKTGLVDVQLSEWIHDAFKARQEADYGYETVDPEATAKETVARAERFVSGVRPVLDSLIRGLGTAPPAAP